MTQPIRSCALVTRFADARVAETAGALAHHLRRRQVTPLALEDEIDRFDGAQVEGLAPDALAARADLVVAIGGDGTLLYAAGLVSERGTPLLGINRGRLGFLTDVMPGDMIEGVDAALDGHCVVDKRTLLSAELRGREPGTGSPGTGSPGTGNDGTIARGLALNDVVMQKYQTGHLVDFETWINGRYVNTHGGDGLVVASSTGSTAYALSCGGPIVDPQLEVVVVAPICPHTLSDRPIVVSALSTIEIRLVDRPDTSAEITCDGRVLGTLEPGGSLRVEQSTRRITLLHPAGYDYFRLLRSKLHWGRRSFDTPR